MKIQFEIEEIARDTNSVTFKINDKVITLAPAWSIDRLSKHEWIVEAVKLYFQEEINKERNNGKK